MNSAEGLQAVTHRSLWCAAAGGQVAPLTDETASGATFRERAFAY